MAIGDRVNEAVEAAKQALDDLYNELQPKIAEFGGNIQAKLEELSTRIDEIQAAVQQRGGDGATAQDPGVATEQAPGGVSGGTPPPV